jgi:hypothetical protein
VGAGTGFEQPQSLSVPPLPFDGSTPTACFRIGPPDVETPMQFQDRLAEEAFTEVAALLATAYQRYVAVPRVPSEPPNEPPKELDKSRPSSPHGQ